ncbi:MAG TPA: hypothetical protein VJV78_24250 [Polyangiales bacterium]|nr:hypothetical protein [Polyangiales bacterium]
MSKRQQIARVSAYSTVGLTALLLACLALDILGRYRSDTLRDSMDVPMALASWAYALVTPIASALALWLGTTSTQLRMMVKVLVALWLLGLALLFFLPFLASASNG